MKEKHIFLILMLLSFLVYGLYLKINYNNSKSNIKSFFQDTFLKYNKKIDNTENKFVRQKEVKQKETAIVKDNDIESLLNNIIDDSISKVNNIEINKESNSIVDDVISSFLDLINSNNSVIQQKADAQKDDSQKAVHIHTTTQAS